MWRTLQCCRQSVRIFTLFCDDDWNNRKKTCEKYILDLGIEPEYNISLRLEKNYNHKIRIISVVCLTKNWKVEIVDCKNYIHRNIKWFLPWICFKTEFRLSAGKQYKKNDNRSIHLTCLDGSNESNYIIQVNNFMKIPHFSEKFDRFFYTADCHVEFPFKFFDKMVSKQKGPSENY